MLKVMVACGCGMGSSQMMKMRASAILKELNVEATIHHTSVDEAMSTANSYDVVIVSETLLRNFKQSDKTILIGLKNLMSKDEMREKLLAANIVDNAK